MPTCLQYLGFPTAFTNLPAFLQYITLSSDFANLPAAPKDILDLSISYLDSILPNCWLPCILASNINSWSPNVIYYFSNICQLTCIPAVPTHIRDFSISYIYGHSSLPKYRRACSPCRHFAFLVSICLMLANMSADPTDILNFSVLYANLPACL